MIILPDYVNQIINRIESAGYEAFAVGGCVRDLLRGAAPLDFDIASSCPPEELKGLFERTFDTGLRYGTITILYSGEAVEVTRYRVDGEYTDSRRPENITPADSITLDLARRDFTINAMAYNQERGLIDPFGGAEDLSAGIIRCVGEPAERFNEDALRILRAFRFAARLGFEIENSTLRACKAHSAGLQNVSVERIFAELVKLITAPFPSKSRELISDGIIGFTGLWCTHGIPENFDLLPNIRELRAAALCYICGADPEEVFTALKSDNLLKRRAGELIRALKMPLPIQKYQLKRAFNTLAPEHWEPLLEARRLLLGENITQSKKSLNEVIKKSEPWTVGELAVKGEDAADLGFKGAEIGEILNRLLEHVTRFPEDNTREALTKIAEGFQR